MVMNYLHTFYFDANKEAKDCFTMLVNGERVSKIPKVHEQETARGIRVILTNFKYDEMINVFAYFKIGGGDNVIRISPFRRIKNTFEFYYPAMDEGDYECEIVVTMNNNVVSSGVFQGHCDRSIRGEYYHGVVVGDTVEGIVNAYSTAKALYETGIENMNKLTTEGQEIVDQNKKIVEVEKARVEAEDTRKANEEERQFKETERQELLANIKSSYDEITSDEETRKQNEEQRKSNEALRRESEDTRVGSENTRVENENIRISNEEERKSNELNRQEQYKKFNEKVDEFTTVSSRIVTDMEEFSTDEETRKRNENSRQDSIRTIKEDFSNIKALSEDAYNKEIERQNKEKIRISNEEERIANEEARKLIDKEREKTKDDVEKLSNEIKSLNNEASSSIDRINELKEIVSKDIETAKTTIENVENEFNTIKEKNIVLEENENNRKVAESNREAKENERQGSENTRISNENQRDSSEQERNSNENIRKSNEDTRVKNEEERKANYENALETVKKVNESKTELENKLKEINDAESSRVEEENRRKENFSAITKTSETIKQEEEARKQNEITRQQQEQVRVDSENVRNSSEETRKQNEIRRSELENALNQLKTDTNLANESTKQKIEELNTLKSTLNDDETKRKALLESLNTSYNEIKSTENTRVEQEEVRVQNEAERKSSESARNNKEQERQRSEDERISNETQRVEAEKLRQSNELQRVQAEKNREANAEIVKGWVANPHQFDGKSAYEVWKSTGKEGSVEDYIASLKGEKGQDGADAKMPNVREGFWYIGDENTGVSVKAIDMEPVHIAINNKIKEVVGTAPETLDTFGELAKALNNDPNFSESIKALINEKADKGYIPEHIPAINITEDETHKFISTEDKKKINASLNNITITGDDTNYILNLRQSDGNTNTVNIAKKLSKSDENRILKVEQDILTKADATDLNKVVTGITKGDNYSLKINKKDGTSDTITLDKPITSYNDLTDKPDLSKLKSVVTDNTVINNASISGQTITLNRVNGGVVNVEIPKYDDTSVKSSIEELERKNTEKDSLISSNKEGLKNAVTDISISDKTITVTRDIGNKSIQLPTYNYSEIVGTPSLDGFYKSATITEDNKLKLTKNNDTFDELTLPKGFSGNYSDLSGIPSDLVTNSTLESKIQGLNLSQYQLANNMSNYVLNSKLTETLNGYQPKGEYVLANDFENILKNTQIDFSHDEIMPLERGIQSISVILSKLESSLNDKADNAIFNYKLSQYDGKIKDLSEKKVDKTELNNYQAKGDYVTNTSLDEKLKLKADSEALAKYNAKGKFVDSGDLNPDGINDVLGDIPFSKLDEKKVTLKSILSQVVETAKNIEAYQDGAEKIFNNTVSKDTFKSELSKYQPIGDYASNEDIDTLEDKIRTIKERNDELFTNLIIGGHFISDISLEDGKLIIQNFPTITEGSVGSPERIQLELPKYSYSDLTDLPKDLINSSTLESKLELKANVSDLANYQLKGNYITSEVLTERLNSKADKTEILSYATKEELSAKANTSDLDNYQLKGNYITSEIFTEKLNGKVDISTLNSYALKTDLTDKITQSTLNSTLSNYVKTNDLNSKLDLKMDKTSLSVVTPNKDGLMKASDKTKLDNINIWLYARKDYVDGELNKKIDKIELGNLSLKNEKDGSKLKVWIGSQEEYDKIGSKDNSILYIIKEAQ